MINFWVIIIKIFLYTNMLSLFIINYVPRYKWPTKINFLFLIKSFVINESNFFILYFYLIIIKRINKRKSYKKIIKID